MIRTSGFRFPTVLLFAALGACCLEDDNGNCKDGCLHDSDQKPCYGARPPDLGHLTLKYAEPSEFDSVVIELHASAEVETSQPFLVLRPTDGEEWAKELATGSWSARAVYWKGEH